VKFHSNQGSAQTQLIVDNAGRDENEQFSLVVLALVVPEQVAQNRNISEERNLGRVVADFLNINTADDNRAAVLDNDFGLDVLGVDRDVAAGNRLVVTGLVLVHLDGHHDLAVRGDLRLYFQRKIGFLEADGGCL